MDSAWDQLIDLVEQLATDAPAPIGPEAERTLETLCTEAIAVHDVDQELSPTGAARWLVGLVAAHRAVRDAHPDVDPDTDVAELRRIVTRWLHPARPR